jgi:signal transduction histidine kinase
MTDVPLVAGTAARAGRRDAPRARARALLAGGGLLLAAALVLLALIEAANAPSAERSSAAHELIRIASAAALLPIGALMLARAPAHPIGWLIAAAGLGKATANASDGYATYSHFVNTLPAGEWIGWVGEWAGATIILIPATALLLFPDGRLPSHRWRGALWCGLAATALIALNGALSPGDNLTFQGNPFLSDETARAVGDPFLVGWLLMVPATIAGIVAIAARRRSAAGDEREQLRVLERAATVVAIGFLACVVTSLAAPDAFDVGAVAALLSLTVLAAGMAVAILRHRLYGLDVFVDRAFVLSGLTVVLGGLYVAAVLGVGHLLGEDVRLGVALPATIVVAIAFQPLRERLQRGVNRLLHGQRDEPYAAISKLGRRLGEAMAPDEVLPVMVATIADTLRLPYAAVELSQAHGSPVVAHGTPAAGVALRLPLVHAGERVGTLIVGARTHGEPLAAADRRLLEDFARRASAAASAVALSVEVQRSRERLVTAREEERRRLRDDLHDGLGPTLAGAVLTIEAAQRVLTTDPSTANELLDRAATSIEGTVSDVRRVVYALRPPALDELGLTGALRQHAATLSSHGDLTCDLAAPDPPPPLPAAVEVAAFRIAQEALTNVARHAHAHHATVTITVTDALRLEIRDDGRGLPADHRAGVGLTSMRERATELGGRFHISSPADGGTRVRVDLPLPPIGTHP